MTPDLTVGPPSASGSGSQLVPTAPARGLPHVTQAPYPDWAGRLWRVREDIPSIEEASWGSQESALCQWLPSLVCQALRLLGWGAGLWQSLRT